MSLYADIRHGEAEELSRRLLDALDRRGVGLVGIKALLKPAEGVAECTALQQAAELLAEHALRCTEMQLEFTRADLQAALDRFLATQRGAADLGDLSGVLDQVSRLRGLDEGVVMRADLRFVPVPAQSCSTLSKAVASQPELTPQVRLDTALLLLLVPKSQLPRNRTLIAPVLLGGLSERVLWSSQGKLALVSAAEPTPPDALLMRPVGYKVFSARAKRWVTRYSVIEPSADDVFRVERVR